MYSSLWRDENSLVVYEHIFFLLDLNIYLKQSQNDFLLKKIAKIN